MTTINRKTSETQITVELNLYGSGKYNVNTGVPFLDHMLELWAKHGLFDLSVTATGDIEIDDHHTVEDIGLCIGEAIDKALSDKTGIYRYGFFILPMDEALVEVVFDLSGRPFVVFDVNWQQEKIKDFDVSLIEEFWRAVGIASKANLHIILKYGKDAHHISEAIFKAAARALCAAAAIDPRRKDIPSTKGTL